jgi:hypothetical protein
MPIVYDGKKLIPAPFVEIHKEYQTTEDGERIGSLYVLTLKGKIVSDKGSPDSTKTFWAAADYPPDETLAADAHFPTIMRKQEAIRALFADQGKTLEIMPYNGAAPMKCNPRVKSIDFPSGNWVFNCEYTIVLECDILYVAGKNPYEDESDIFANQHISRLSDDWQLESTDDKLEVYKLSRTLSVTGKRFYDENGGLVRMPWENAKKFIQDNQLLGLSAGTVLGDYPSGQRKDAVNVLDLSGYEPYDYVRGESVNELAGTVVINETWTVFNPEGEPPALHEQEITTKVSSEDGRAVVTVNGTITGLSVWNNSHARSRASTRYTNGSAKWDIVYPTLKATAESISGYTLQATPASQTVGKNSKSGVITYNFEFNNRPNISISGAFSESITVTDEGQANVFAQIPILGRVAGPLLQDIGTFTAKRRTLSIEAVFSAGTLSVAAPTKPDTTSLVAAQIPSGSVVFMEKDDEVFSPNTGRYTRTVSWVYES